MGDPFVDLKNKKVVCALLYLEYSTSGDLLDFCVSQLTCSILDFRWESETESLCYICGREKVSLSADCSCGTHTAVICMEMEKIKNH